jgi:hypothetical protein
MLGWVSDQRWKASQGSSQLDFKRAVESTRRPLRSKSALATMRCPKNDGPSSSVGFAFRRAAA